MKTPEEREAYWAKEKRKWLEKERKFREQHKLVHSVVIGSYNWRGAGPQPGDPELQAWIDALSDAQELELASLLKQKGTYSEDQVLADWILEHDGRLWFRHAACPQERWEKR